MCDRIYIEHILFSCDNVSPSVSLGSVTCVPINISLVMICIDQNI